MAKKNIKTQEKKRFVVCIDAGHGIDTKGNSSPDKSLYEWKWSREVADFVYEGLSAHDIDARIIVTEENDVNLTERCKRINEIYDNAGKGNCISVSIHVDAEGSDGKWHDAKGWSVFVSKNASESSMKLAGCLHDTAHDVGLRVRRPMPNQKYWVKNLAMCRDTKCPAVLVENLFMDNMDDCKFLNSGIGKRTCADVIVFGILRYLGK